VSKFKVGDRVRCIECSGVSHGPQQGSSYTVSCLGHSDDIGLKELGESTPGWFVSRFILDAPQTKEQKAIAKAEADLQALKDKAAKKARDAAGRKAKAERVKVMRGLTAGGRRIVEALRDKPEAFGCQREMAIALAAAITGDDADKIRKALA
jgi:hypothetical protein